MNYNALIIGAGNIGAGFDTPESTFYLTHAHAYSMHPQFNLIGFVEPNKKIAEREAHKWRTVSFSSIEEAFEKNTIDVVSIAVPDELHYEILKKIAFFKPKYVFTEKPLTKTLQEAKEILDLYSHYEIPLSINYKRRFTPEFIQLREKIVSKHFGDFMYGNAYYGKGFIHNGSHTIDLLLHLTNDSWYFHHYLDNVIDFTESDPSYSVILKNNQHKLFTIKSLDSNLFGIFEMDFIFEKGRIRISNTGLTIEEFTVKPSEIFPSYKLIQLDENYTTQLDNSLLSSVEHIYDFLANGKSAICTLKEGYKTMEVTQDIVNKCKQLWQN